VKRWVMGTLHGSISPEHMPAYFDEWVFRFNRRHSRSRGLLFRPHPTAATPTRPSAMAAAQPRTRRVRPALARPRSLSILSSYGTEMETPLYVNRVPHVAYVFPSMKQDPVGPGTTFRAPDIGDLIAADAAV
jgi:hypothetical protein